MIGNRFRKILMVTVALLLMGAVFVGAASATFATDGGIEWELADGVLTIKAATTPESGYTAGKMKNYPSASCGPWGVITTNTTLDIQSGVTNIGYYAFQYCTGLTGSVVIPSGVTTIGWRAFEECSGLTSITIPSSVTIIEEYAFNKCSKLVSISVDAENPNYSSDSNGVLYNKDKTTLIRYPAGNTTSTFTIPSSVTTIENYAFEDSTSLTSITIPGSVTSIGNYAFYYCTGLTSITIPNSVTKIGYGAFFMCSGLTSITIPNTVTKIESSSFFKCTSLTSITIPSSVTSIGNSAFQYCTSLTSITIPSSVTTIEEYAFDCSGLTGSIVIPSTVTTIGYAAFSGCSKLVSISVDSNNPNYLSDNNGVLYDKNQTTLICYPAGNTTSTYTIPGSVTTISTVAFEECSGLTSITIPSSVTTISSGAFYHCTGLTSITIPSGVTTIENLAFYRCSGLTGSLVIPSSVTTIKEYAFLCCPKLDSVLIEGEPEVEVGALGINIDRDETGTSIKDLTKNSVIYVIDNDIVSFYDGSTGNVLGYTTAIAVKNDDSYVFNVHPYYGMGTEFEVKDKFELRDAFNPTKEGYTFKGWYDNEELSGTPVTSIPKGKSTTLYAKWNDDPECTVTYTSSEGTCSDYPVTAEKGSSYNLLSSMPEGWTAPSGKVLTGWTIEGTDYDLGDSYTVTKDVTATAIWKEKTIGGEIKSIDNVDIKKENIVLVINIDGTASQSDDVNIVESLLITDSKKQNARFNSISNSGVTITNDDLKSATVGSDKKSVHLTLNKTKSDALRALFNTSMMNDTSKVFYFEGSISVGETTYEATTSMSVTIKAKTTTTALLLSHKGGQSIDLTKVRISITDAAGETWSIAVPTNLSVGPSLETGETLKLNDIIGDSDLKIAKGEKIQVTVIFDERHIIFDKAVRAI